MDMARYALVIGIAQYNNPLLRSLSKTETDAEAVAQVFKKYGNYGVTLLKGKVTAEEVNCKLTTLLLEQAVDNEALIYFTGHGIKGLAEADTLAPEKGYLAASDCEVIKNAEKWNVRRGIGLESLNTLIQQSNLKNLVVILDSCYSGEFLERTLLENSFTAFKTGKDYALITACRRFEKALAKKSEEHSVFTGALLEGLSPTQAGEGHVTTNQLFDFIDRKLRDSVQEPIYLGRGRTIDLVSYPAKPDKTDNASSNAAKLTHFVTHEVFFSRFLNPNNLFNHSWSLVGRINFIEELHDFIRSEQHRIVIMVGRGGIGKTKVLQRFAQEFSIHHHNLVLRFLWEELPITKESLEELPTDPCVIVVDDAHRCHDLPILLAFVQQQTCLSIKIILSCRPHGTEMLQSILGRAGFDMREILDLREMKELSKNEVKELASQALGSEFSYLSARLAAETGDSPLFTVVGGRLVAEKELSPSLLNSDREFQKMMLEKFKDVLIGQISDKSDPQRSQSILNLIAAVSPIDIDNPKFLQAAADFLKIDSSNLSKDIENLESSGVLLRRGMSLRITPDVLGDYILHEACLTTTGKATGYAQQVFEKFKSICPTRLLRNIAKLDWRIYRINSEETDLLTDIWQTITNEFRQTSNYERWQLLDILKDMAYYQPARMLKLIQFARSNPATRPEDSTISEIYTYTPENVLKKLPKLLERISYTIDYLPLCCDLLWELQEYGGIAVLTELAHYDIDKPLEFNQLVLEAVTRWMKEPDVHNRVFSPLDVLDPLLDKSSYSTHLEGRQVTFTPFAISLEHTLSIRNQALKLIADCAYCDRLNVILRVVTSLEKALRQPVGVFNREITHEEEASWIPEQLQILEIIEKLIERVTEPLVNLKIIDTLLWHTQYSSSNEVKQRAKNIIESIPKSHELLLTQALRHCLHWDGLVEDGEESGPDSQKRYQQRIHRAESQCLAIAQEFLQRHPDANEGIECLSERLNILSSHDKNPYPWDFLGKLSESNPSYAARICEALIDRYPDSSLSPYLYPLLYGVKIQKFEIALALAQRAVDTENTILCKAIAGRYWNLEITKKLLCRKELEIKTLAIGSLLAIKDTQPQVAIEIAMTVDLDSSTDLASELCQLFNPQNGILPDKLTNEQLNSLIWKLERITNIENSEISQFFAYAAKRSPRAVIQLLLKRIERYEQNADPQYKPLPSIAFHHGLDGVAESAEYADILRDIRDRALQCSGQTASWLPKLFTEVSRNFTPVSLDVLNEWVDSGEATKINAVGCLLSNAFSGFVFSHVEFVKNLLEKADSAGEKCCQIVSSYLRRSAISGSSGELFIEEFNYLHDDRASIVANQLIFGSPGHQFYDSLVQYYKASIKQQRILSEEDFSE